MRKASGGAHALVWLLMAVGVVACSDHQPERDAPRTVLVTHAGAQDGAVPVAFAGEVHARQESPLSFRVGGQLVRRLVDAGSVVNQGQLLAELDAGDARLQADAAKADMLRLQGDLERYRTLLADQLVSRSAFDAQQSAYRAARAKYDLMNNQSRYTRLLAPTSGVIASRMAEAGQVVAAGQPVFTLAADSGREVAISLPEARIRDFHTGQPAIVELWSAPGVRLPAHVREIAAVADPQTRTYAARVALEDDAAAQVELGQSARVFMRSATDTGELRLPLAAVQRSAAGGDAVWVVGADHRVQQRRVTLGAYGEDTVPVVSGVTASDWVVAAGGHLLHAGEVVSPVDRNNRSVTSEGH